MSKTILKNYLPAGNGEKVEDIIKNLNQWSYFGLNTY